MPVNFAWLMKVLSFILDAIKAGHEAGLFDKDASVGHDGQPMVHPNGLPNLEHPYVRALYDAASEHIGPIE